MDWQPIETAPKDGSLVLLYRRHLWGHHENSYDAARWDAARGEWRYEAYPQKDDGSVWGAEWVTHWAPLEPPAPLE